MKISEREFPPDSLFSDKQSTSFDTWLLVDATDERRRDFLGSVMTEREKLPGYRRKPNKVISTLSLNVASCCPQPGFQFRILHNVNVLKLIIQHCKGSIFAPLHQINSCEILLDRKKKLNISRWPADRNLKTPLLKWQKEASRDASTQ